MTKLFCDICKEEPWDEEDKPMYVLAGLSEYICGARLCRSCRVAIEATLDRLAGRHVTKDMRAFNWGEGPCWSCPYTENWNRKGGE